jgi:hypothetical protein
VHNDYAFQNLNIPIDDLHVIDLIDPNEIEGENMKAIPPGGPYLDMDKFVEFYASYCECFQILIEYHAVELEALKQEFPDYRYLTRYLDKYLWLLGNP